eukprot:Blabericola_migrator_1__119@NODE_102_length_14292_cov_312_776380_g90_i0_p5_GENE_NODE_102_length_14292_cov_312_776380_g90_i0NODE_102_length_14292_cov_312_776380_g90_i0_p5_ORF_typecomplete_len338_score39_93Scramblase/PF03803_15/1_6e32LOR/PF04525_12/2_2LOR/PF04525_12/49_NODE_102_length_14292_cov_312_776380_g90_i039294942
MTFTLPEPYPAHSFNLTSSIPGMPPNIQDNRKGPSPNDYAMYNEGTPLLNKHQRVMGPSNKVVEFEPLNQCRVARLSECSDDSLVGAFQDLVGLQDSRTFQIVDFDRKTPLFFTKETANCCERNCFPALCRPEHTEIYRVESNGSALKIAKMDRSCCGGSVSITDSNNRRIGQISSKYSCSRLLMTVKASDSRQTYTVASDRWGFTRWFGKLPFGSCRAIQFQIVKPDGHPVALISNEWTGLLREIFTDADDYFVEFGYVSDVKERLLLLCTAIFIDSLYFSGMFCNWTIRSLVMKKFNPVNKMTKVGKLGTYIPVVYNTVMGGSNTKKPGPYDARY